MRRFWNLYQRQLRRFPLLTEMVASGTLWCVGDAVAQQLEQPSTRFDWHRNVIQTVYASCIWAPFAHHWYPLLDRTATYLATTTTKSNSNTRKRYIVLTKLALEIVCLHPVSLLLFFGCVGKLEGEDTVQIINQLRTDFWPTLWLEILLWTPLDAFMFGYIPVRHQLLVVNCGCLVESIGLSWIKRHGVKERDS